MVDQVALSRALSAAVAQDGPKAALAVCRACVAWLPMTGAAITVMAGTDRQEPVCATDAAAARIDQVQFDLGDGPCVEAFTSGRAVLVADLADVADQRWPVFAAAATDTGARGVFVLPLRVGAKRLGVLDCYRDTPGSLDDRELTAALRAADAAVWTLLSHVDQRAVAAEGPGSDWFDHSALARAEVHQATGMLLVQADLSAPAALAQLRAAAFAQDRTLEAVAGDVVARRLRLHRDGSWHTRNGHHHAHPPPPRAPGAEGINPAAGEEEN